MQRTSFWKVVWCSQTDWQRCRRREFGCAFRPDYCEARSWHGWHRHMFLAMAAAAFLTKLAADQRRLAFSNPRSASKRRSRMTFALADLLTTAEIRHLVAKRLLKPKVSATFVWLWSRWRGDHQAKAAKSHRKRYKCNCSTRVSTCWSVEK